MTSFQQLLRGWFGAGVLSVCLALGLGTGTVRSAESPAVVEPAAAPPPAASPAADAPPAAAVGDATDGTGPGAEIQVTPENGRKARAKAKGQGMEKLGKSASLRLNELVSIGSDARVATNQVSKDVVVINGDADLEGDVDGDVVVVFGHLKLKGTVSGDVVVVMGRADVDGEIKGETSLIFSPSRIGARARMDGEVLSVGGAPDIHPDAHLSRTPEVVLTGPLMGYLEWARDYVLQGVVWLRPFPPRVGWVWIAAGLFLTFHLALSLILATPLRACMTTVREQPARSFLVGLLASVLIGPVSVLLSFTVVATPLVWLAFMAICLFGRVAVYGAAGAGLGRLGGGDSLRHPFPAVLVGSVLFYVAYMIPLVGYLVYWLVVPWGVGACLIRMSEALRRERRSNGPGTGGISGVPSLPVDGGGDAFAVSGLPGRPATVSSTIPLAGSAAEALAGGTAGPATHAAVSEMPPTMGSGTSPGGVPPSLGAAPNVTQAPFGASESAVQPRVGCGPRLGAAIIDLIVVGFVNGMTFGEARSFWLLLGLYHLAMWTWRGTTLGGTILGLRVVRLDGRAMDWQTAGVRVLASVISLVPLGIGFIWASWDEQSQSWHDRIAGTTVVRLDRRTSLV